MCGNKSVGGGGGRVAMQKKAIPTMGLNSKVYFMVILRQLANLEISFIIFLCEHLYFNFSKQTEGSFRSISNLVAGLPKDILTSTQNYRHK